MRLDLFGDTLDSIRSFDPETQRSTRQLQQVDLLPVSEVLLDDKSISRFRTGYVAEFGAPGDDALYASVSEGVRRAGVEHWLPLFYDKLETVFDYIGPDALIALDHLAAESLNERLALIADAHDAPHRDGQDPRRLQGPAARRPLPDRRGVGKAPGRPPQPPLHPLPARGRGGGGHGGQDGPQLHPERAQDSVRLFETVGDHARALAAAGKRVLFASWSEGSSERLGMMLADHGLQNLRLAPYWDAARAADPKLPQRVVLPLDNGFETASLAVISETDILGDRLARPRRRRRAANFLAEATALTPGDLVVHIDHGIGRYAGLTTLEVQGAPHDCLELHYFGDSKLYLPVENIDLLTPLWRRERGGAARPPGRRRVAGQEGARQGAAARDGRGA